MSSQSSQSSQYSITLKMNGCFLDGRIKVESIIQDKYITFKNKDENKYLYYYCYKITENTLYLIGNRINKETGQLDYILEQRLDKDGKETKKFIKSLNKVGIKIDLNNKTRTGKKHKLNEIVETKANKKRKQITSE